MSGDPNLYAAAFVVAVQALRCAVDAVIACLDRRPIPFVLQAAFSVCSFSVAFHVWSAA